jgi:hypothetical protein
MRPGSMMRKDPTIAIRDYLAEIEVLDGIAARLTRDSFKRDPIVRRAARRERMTACAS